MTYAYRVIVPFLEIYFCDEPEPDDEDDYWKVEYVDKFFFLLFAAGVFYVSMFHWYF